MSSKTDIIVNDGHEFPWKQMYCTALYPALLFISDSNKDPNNLTIISALVDEGLTPIIQVPDVAVNKVFKQKLKKKYYKHQLEQHAELGKKVRISREKVVDFILVSIDDINQESTKYV
jgi:hypothetical protein